MKKIAEELLKIAREINGVQTGLSEKDVHEFYKTIRDGEYIKTHRCKVCWPDVTKVDNGFLPVEEYPKYPHSRWCPFRGKF